MDLRVLTWNVFHGRTATRSARGLGRDLYEDFAAALKGWAWDVALLQEVPPWWAAQLERTLCCEACGVFTSRNWLLPVRRALAVRAPDLMGAGGGGANVILARSDRIVGANSALLCRWPERRRVVGVALAPGVWVSNLHASAGPAAERDVRAAVRASWEWARVGRLPLILGGDLNLPAVEVEGLRVAASSGVDHILCGAAVDIRPGSMQLLERGPLSVHAPLAVTLVI